MLVLVNALRKVFFERLSYGCSEGADKDGTRAVLQSTVSCEVLASCTLWFLAAPPTFPALSSEERKAIVLYGSKLLKVTRVRYLAEVCDTDAQWSWSSMLDHLRRWDYTTDDDNLLLNRACVNALSNQCCV